MNWVKNPTEESDVFWKEWLGRHPECHEQFNMARGTIERVNFKGDARIGERKEEILDAILKESTSSFYKKGKGKRIPVRKMLPVLYKLVAASVVFILMSTYLYSSFSVHAPIGNSPSVEFITKSNPRGKKTSFFLPDKTKVTLNSSSSLSYSTDFKGDIREVFLEGEAYFDVSHDPSRSFLVWSGEVITQVHGTAFNVSAYPEEPVNIALERGLVSVYPTNPERPTIPYYLKPGEMLDVQSDFEKSEKLKYNYSSEFGWKEGLLVFNGADLHELTSKLERWYNVNITVEGKASDTWRVNGSFDNESLENVLKGISYARNIRYELSGDQVKIKI